MKTRLIALFFSLILFLFCASACDRDGGEKKAAKDFFPVNEKYPVGVIIDTLETKGRIFFTEDGLFHFIHEDPTSPLFALEEVFSKESVHAYFHDMEYEMRNSGKGTAVLYEIMDIIRNQTPEETKTEEGTIKNIYEDGEDLSLIFTCDGKTLTPIQISGTVENQKIEINFSSQA